MDKIDHKSKDILGGNVEKIAELFPGVVTEAQDEVTGELKKVVDFDLLRQHLSDELVEGDRERFRLDWPGKKASILKANTPTTKTLRPVREDSEDFDTTQNIFIEGDNFDVLKVLQESYLGKIKMIYIDPPYNTGQDFIYKDNFASTREDFEEEVGVRDDENGGKLVKITGSHGRYHSDWLSMMQERLIVARDLLTDDGILFISIGQDEVDNLTKLTKEVFGENNYISTISRVTKKTSDAGTYFAPSIDYVLVCAKDIDSLAGFKVSLSDTQLSSFNLEDKKGKYKLVGFYQASLSLERSRNARYYVEAPDGTKCIPPEGKRWRTVRETYDQFIEEDKIVFKETRTSPLLDEDGKQSKWNIYTKSYIHDRADAGVTPRDFIDDIQNNGGNRALKDLELDKYFDFPKPTQLIRYLAQLVNLGDGDLVLDFFSGSSTTAHAVMQLNAEDGGNRRHIQVQLAEPTDEKSEAYKAGYKTIPEISRERIRRAAKKIREDYAEQIAKRDTPLDTGFRAYKLASSNFVDTAQHPNETTQASLLDVTDNIKEGRTAEDLLTEVILDLGLTLDLPIEQRDIAGHTVFFVGGNSLVACFDDKVSLDIVDGIAAEKPLRVVFKDSSFANDETRINIDIRLKQLSPDTTVQVV